MRRAALAFLLVLAAAAQPASAAEKDAWLAVGKPFPLISLPRVGDEGRRGSIERYRGRKLLVHCFASW